MIKILTGAVNFGLICWNELNGKQLHISYSCFNFSDPFWNFGLTTSPSRKHRQPYTELQIAALEREYEKKCFIGRFEREDIARDLGLSDRQVKIWFQNRRVKDKKLKQRETEKM